MMLNRTVGPLSDTRSALAQNCSTTDPASFKRDNCTKLISYVMNAPGKTDTFSSRAWERGAGIFSLLPTILVIM
jgi:hypothetical protein